MTHGKRIVRRQAALFSVLLIALASLTCSGPRAPARYGQVQQPAGRATDHVVLVAIDGVRWQDVFVGVDEVLAKHQDGERFLGTTAEELLPNLTELSEQGVALGRDPHPMFASGPDFVSLPGYTELFEGRGPTGCFTNTCGGATRTTFVEKLAERSSPFDVAAFGSWPKIARAVSKGAPQFVVSMGREQLAPAARASLSPALLQSWEQGRAAKPFPGHGAFRPDALTAKLALEYLEEHQPKFLFLGLGEPDEYAHRGDYGGYLTSLAYADDVVGRVRQWARYMRGSGDRVTIWITTDHGREAAFVGHGWSAPESARIWAIAAGDGIARTRQYRTTTRRRLADTGPTLAYLLGLSIRAARDGRGRVLDEALEGRPNHFHEGDRRIAYRP